MVTQGGGVQGQAGALRCLLVVQNANQRLGLRRQSRGQSSDSEASTPGSVLVGGSRACQLLHTSPASSAK